MEGMDDLNNNVKKSYDQIKSKTETVPQKLVGNSSYNPKLTRLIEQNCMVINIRGQEDETRKWKGMLWEEMDHIKLSAKIYKTVFLR